MIVGVRTRQTVSFIGMVWVLLSTACARASTHHTRDGEGSGRATVVAKAPSPGSSRPLPGQASSPSPSPDPIAQVLEFSTKALGWKSHLADIHRDDAFANEQATFLGRDLGVASLLRTRTTVAFANVFEPVDGRRLHLGVVEITFKRCADLERTMTGVARLHRNHFKVAALSEFRTLRRGRSFIIVFSESSLEPVVRDLLRSREAFASTECRDGDEG